MTRPMLDAAMLGPVQKDALRRQMLYADGAFQFYRRTFRECGISRRDIAESDPVSLLRSLPAMTGDRFQELTCESIRAAREVVDIEVSSGTTGPPKRRIITCRDEAAETEILTRLFAACGIGPGDSVACVDTGPLTLMVSFTAGLERLGVDDAYAFSVSVDDDATVAALSKLQPTVVVTIPSIIDRVLAPLASAIRQKAWPLQKVVYVGEPMREDTRRTLETGLGVEVFAYYGASETSALGIECPAHAGIHLFTDWNVVEIVGQREGEALVTTLRREGLPLLRYALGDVLRAREGSCPCGLDYPRVEVLGRTDGAVSVLGVKLSYDAVHRAALWPLDYDGPIAVELSGNGRDRMAVMLPKSLAAHERTIVRSMNTREPDLAYLIASGFLSLDVSFVEETRLESRKAPRIVDRRTPDQAGAVPHPVNAAI